MKSIVSKMKCFNTDSEIFQLAKNNNLVDYIIKAFKVLECEYVEMLDYELITDAREFDPEYINPKYIKNPKNKKYTHRLNLKESRYDLLKIKFKIRGLTPKDKGGEQHWEEKIVTTKLLLFKKYDNYYLLIDGNKYYPIFQLVDSSTYNTKNSVVFKSMLMRIDLDRKDNNIIYTVEGEQFKAPTFILRAFRKKVNPIYYYLAALGLQNTLAYMNMEDIIRVVPNRLDNDEEYVFPANSGLFVNVKKYFFDNDYFTRSMVAMLVEVLCKDYMTIYYVNKIDTWAIELGLTINSKANKTKSKKKSKKKEKKVDTNNPDNLMKTGLDFLYSFHRLLDEITKDELHLRDYNKENVFAIVRWIIRNYTELKAKDNMDLKYKRVRNEEYQASYIIPTLNKRMTRFLNQDNKTIGDVEDLVKIKQKELVTRSISSKTGLLRYDNSVNDMDFFTRLKFTMKGPNAIGNSSAVKIEYRGVHPSYIGREDVTSCGSSDPGLTSIFTPFVKIYDNGYFHPDPEPQSWDDDFLNLYSNYFKGTKYRIRDLDYYENMTKDKKKDKVKKQDIMKMVKNNPHIKNNSFIFDDNACKMSHLSFKKVKKPKKKATIKFKRVD